MSIVNLYSSLLPQKRKNNRCKSCSKVLTFEQLLQQVMRVWLVTDAHRT